jgi:hypothetical protein
MVAASGDAHRTLRAAARIRVGAEDCIGFARGPGGFDGPGDGDMDTAREGTDPALTMRVPSHRNRGHQGTATSAG